MQSCKTKKVINNNGKKWGIVVEYGKNCIIFTIQLENLAVVNFIGDYTCKLDEKGRVLLPAAFIKQMASGLQERFVIKKDIFENCLILYPMSEWERQNQILRRNTNPYNREHNQFLREFYKGTADLMLDASNRLLIPKRLLERISADREIVMAGQLGKIEIWPTDIYEKQGLEDGQFAALAEKIMGNLYNEQGE
jgi:MraZ protein